MEVMNKEQVQILISEGKSIDNTDITGLNLYNSNLFEDCKIKTKVIFDSCTLTDLDFACVEFFEEVIFNNCTINSAIFSSTYFYNGVKIHNCKFNDIFYFDCGGHNNKPYSVEFLDTIFNGYVDFFDSCFFGPVEIINCYFNKGTNLLCDMKAFEVKPKVENTKGNLKLESSM